MNPATACFEIKQSANGIFAARSPKDLSLSSCIHLSFLKFSGGDISKILMLTFVKLRVEPTHRRSDCQWRAAWTYAPA
jgi:hypothetical protein